MALSPSKYRDRILSYSIYSNENKVNDTYSLTSANIRLGINKIGKATFRFNAGNMEKQTFDETDADTFKPGTFVRFNAGDVKTENTLFEGPVVQIKIEIESGKRPQMVVECRDNAFPATLGRKNTLFEKKKDSEILTEILKPYGKVSVDETDYQHPVLVQFYSTDWDFALSRADANGLLVNVKGGTIEIRQADVKASPVLQVTYGNDLLEFNGGLSINGQFDSVEAVSWDPDKQAVIKTTAAEPQLNKQGDLQASDISGATKQLCQTDAPTTESSLKSWIDGIALKNGLARYQGNFLIYGCADVVPGCIIELAGLGKRFNGQAYIGRVEHLIENNHWTTRAYMGISPAGITEQSDVTAPPASGWSPAIEGLHSAKVKQVNDDPQKGFRLLVELPWLNGGKKELWARLATPYAGNTVGYFFLPEPGDEVVIGFFNHDPRHPVILGSMYSGQQAPPYTPESKNNTKAIVTREKMKIEFNEEKKIIILTTPGNNQLEISDDSKSIRLSDENKNELLLDKNGITLNSAKDITLKAKSNILLDAAAKTSVTAKSDVVIEGTNIKANAKAGFSAKGNGTAEVSASGQTTIKGGIVMIN